MKEDIKGILKKIEENTSKGVSPISSNTKAHSHLKDEYVGDPNCPHCAGVGYVRSEAPLGDPNFGRVEICSCRSNEVGQHARKRLYAISRLNELQHLTFESFEARGRVGLAARQADSLEHALNQAQQYAQSLNGWLLLQGGYGSGKTHLAAAIANFAVELGIATIFITVPDLLDNLRFAYSSEDTSFEERFEEIRQAPLLVLDDFGTQNATPWAQEKLFQIINYRYTNQLPLVITTNLALDQIEGRIRSRLSDPELVSHQHILAPDYRRPTADSSQNRVSALHLFTDQTFLTFDLRKSSGLQAAHIENLELAFKAARKYAENPIGWILFSGAHRGGKTHLAAAIANFAADMGKLPLFVIVPDLLDHLRATFNPNSPTSYDRLFEEVRNSELLVLDSLGSQSSTPWAKEKLYQIINHRYNAKLPTVITISGEIKTLDARIESRLSDARLCTEYNIVAPGFSSPQKSRNYSRPDTDTMEI